MPAKVGHPAYNVNGEGGRPRKYSAEDIDRFAEELLIWIKNESNFWIKDFCLEKGIDPRLMTEWAKESERFSESLSVAKSFQESRIFKGAMLDNFNSSMSKFALVNNHGWVDKNETKLSGDSVSPLAFILKDIEGTTKELVNETES